MLAMHDDNHSPWFSQSTNTCWKKLLQKSYQHQHHSHPKQQQQQQHQQEHQTHRLKSSQYKKQYESLAKVLHATLPLPNGNSAPVTPIEGIPTAVKDEARTTAKQQRPQQRTPETSAHKIEFSTRSPNAPAATPVFGTYQSSYIPGNNHYQVVCAEVVAMEQLTPNTDNVIYSDHVTSPMVASSNKSLSGKRPRDVEMPSEEIFQIEHLREKFFKFAPAPPAAQQWY